MKPYYWWQILVALAMEVDAEQEGLLSSVRMSDY